MNNSNMFNVHKFKIKKSNSLLNLYYNYKNLKLKKYKKIHGRI